MNSPSGTPSSGLDRFIGFLETDNGQRIGICVYAIVATAVLLALPGSLAAFVFGVPFMFFIPGFVVVRMFFWQGTSVEAKLVLSLGISILVVILIGLFLVLSPIGLTSDSTRVSLIVFAVGGVALESIWLRSDRKTEKAPERKPVEKAFKIDKVVAAMLATALVVSAVSFGLIVTAQYPSRTYFAITGADGRIVTNATFPAGTNLTILVEVKNGETGPRNFTLVAYGYESSAFGVYNSSRTLQRGEEWTQSVYFNLSSPGYTRLDFDLFIQEGDGPPIFYGNLHLWIRVSAAV